MRVLRTALAVVALFTAALAGFTSEGGVLMRDGHRWRMKGASWFGFETSLAVFHGLWANDYNWYLDFLAENNFNAIRIPFSLDTVINDPMPQSISYGYCQYNATCNLDLKGLSSLQVLDRMVAAAALRNIVVMFDMHSFEPDAYANNGLWYDATHPESLVLQGWDKLLRRYADAPNIIGADLKNEPFQGTWNTGNPSTDWDKAAARIGNHIIASTPSWLIFVEGTANSPPCNVGCFYGGDLVGVLNVPVVLNVTNRLAYSPHCYGPSVYDQPYFNDPSFPANMPAIWDYQFGYIRNMSGPAVVVGEWGGQMTGADLVWMDAWVAYLKARDMTDNFVWCLNPDSGDTGGLLESDWKTPDTAKLALVASLVPTPG
jgi:endoglucanase